MQPSSFIIITGLSGSGKGTFLRALEDRGFNCVDNLPVSLLAKFHELIVKSQDEGSKAAMVIDVREGQTLTEFPAVYQDLKKNASLEMSLWFLEASDNVLVRRFSETRRPHPLGAVRTVLEAIALERQLLAPIRDMADLILDTSQFTIHELRSIEDVVGHVADGREQFTLGRDGFQHRPVRIERVRPACFTEPADKNIV